MRGLIMRTLYIPCLALALAGCASVYDDSHRYEDGWRLAVVSKVAPGNLIDIKATLDCRESLGRDSYYAVTWYRRNHQMRAFVVPVDQSNQPAWNEWVFIRPPMCSKAERRLAIPGASK
jgi:hypothetical protein